MISVAHKMLHLETTTALGPARVIALLSKERTLVEISQTS